MVLNEKVSAYIATAPSEQVAILEALCKLVHDTIDNVSQDIKWGFIVFGKSKDFAYLRFSKKHVTLGFYNIDKLKDPDKLLEGTGNTLKHIKIKSLDDIKTDIIAEWLKQITS